MINGRIITSIPAVKQQSTLYFLEKGTDQFELSLADDRGILRNLTVASSGGTIDLTPYAKKDASGLSNNDAIAWANLIKPHLPVSGGGGTSTPQTLSEVLTAGNKLEGKEIEGDLVVKNTEANGQNYELSVYKNSLYYTSKDRLNRSNSVSINAEGISQRYSGEDENDGLNKTGSFSFNNRGLTAFSESDNHEQGYRLSAELDMLYYNSHALNRAGMFLTFNRDRFHVSMHDSSSTNLEAKVELNFDGKKGLYGDKEYVPTDNFQFVQKKYVDDVVANSAGSSSSQIEVKNKLKGKKVSVIGDSISNYGPSSTEFNSGTGYSFDDTWLGIFLNLTGAKKETVSAVSGSKVLGSTYDAFAYARAEQLSTSSEYILVFMGANDQRIGGSNLGTIRPKNTLDRTINSNYDNFTEAYQIGIEKLLKRHKDSGAQVILMTPLKSFNAGSNDDANPSSDNYAERVIDLAKLYGLRYIDMREVGITNYNHTYYMSDGLHPNKQGHKLIAEYVVSKLIEFGVVQMQGGGSIDAYTKEETDSKIKGIIVGGNNLVKNTSVPIFGQNGPDTGTPEVMKDATGYFVRYTPSATSPVGLYGKKVEGSNLGNHSRSVDVRHSHTGDLKVWDQMVPPNKWVRIKQESFTAPNEFATFLTEVPGVALDLRNYKIELGSKATDWTPHIDEFSTATSSRKIDEVFTISEEGIEAIHEITDAGTSQEKHDVILTGIPYAKDISIIIECYLIFGDGVSTKITDVTVTSTGGIKFPASLASRDVVKKVYIKALIK